MCDRSFVLAAIRICPLTAMKKAPWPSQSVTALLGLAPLAGCRTPNRCDSYYSIGRKLCGQIFPLCALRCKTQAYYP
jgi:hypothetical protein